jgi:hypothetical protein
MVVDHQTKARIAELLEEAEQAADGSTNGLLDREEFLSVIRRLLVVTRKLLAERGQAEAR